MKVLVTGSSGLIGSAAVRHWDKLGADVVGIDNDMRKEFFGPRGVLVGTLSDFKRIRSDSSTCRSIFGIAKRWQTYFENTLSN